MQIMKKTALAALLCALLLCGCAAAPATPAPPPTAPISPAAEPPKQSTSSAELQEELSENYPQRVADELIAELFPQGKNNGNDYAKILAAYEYIIANTFFAPPVGTDIWRVRGGGTPSYVEARALSPLLFGIGSCEDYAAALALLLQRMGFEAEYLPGLTISVDGGFVDHAWVMVKLDGIWYHLDPQLEQNVMRSSTITYRYFLKHDQAMLTDHRWGENLIDYDVLSQEQNAEISASYLGHRCPKEYAQSLAPNLLAMPRRPNRTLIEQNIADEIKQYEATDGALPPHTLDITPPIFGYEGYRESIKH